MVLEYVLQIKFSGERNPKLLEPRFLVSYSVLLSGAQTSSTEYKSENEYEKSFFITLGPERVLVPFDLP